jgi:threonylcarbamoyladenosine tRNA methylthiotransferase MtaB
MDGNFRIRIASMEPFQINKKIIDIITSNNRRWCQHLHLCIQAANDEVINNMKRKYTVSHFINLCEYARSLNPYISISTDYIVGFPTESIKQFENSIINLQHIKFSDMHIFPYSQRKNTLASTFKNLVSDNEKH